MENINIAKDMQEPLFAGDVIIYRSRMYVAGDKRGEIEGTVVKVFPMMEKREYPITVSTGEMIPRSTFMKRVRAAHGKAVEHPHGRWRRLETFTLIAGESNVKTSAQVLKEGLSNIVNDAFAEVNEKMKTKSKSISSEKDSEKKKSKKKSSKKRKKKYVESSSSSSSSDDDDCDTSDSEFQKENQDALKSKAWRKHITSKPPSTTRPPKKKKQKQVKGQKSISNYFSKKKSLMTMASPLELKPTRTPPTKKKKVASVSLDELLGESDDDITTVEGRGEKAQRTFALDSSSSSDDDTTLKPSFTAPRPNTERKEQRQQSPTEKQLDEVYVIPKLKKPKRINTPGSSIMGSEGQKSLAYSKNKNRFAKHAPLSFKRHY